MRQITDLKLIYSFIHAAETGSFTRAADILGITPSGVSKNINVLEEHLGVRLFNRTTRSSSLTLEGKNYLASIKPLIGQFETVNTSLLENSPEQAGIIRFSVAPDFYRIFIEPITSEYLLQNPQVSLDVDCTTKIIDFVQDGMDFVIRGGNIQDSNLISRKLFSFGMLLVASPEYLAKYGTPTQPSDLANHRIIMARYGYDELEYPMFTNAKGKGEICRLGQHVMISSEPNSLLAAAIRGLGIFYTSKLQAKPALDNGSLVEVLPDHVYRGNYNLVIQYPHRTHLAPRVKNLIDVLYAKLHTNEVC
ncbi:LysR family transcriptional regulator [Psittacicella hinzii]|nr:LysR family transcriptional regulator [Psittacicella hinzii]